MFPLYKMAKKFGVDNAIKYVLVKGNRSVLWDIALYRTFSLLSMYPIPVQFFSLFFDSRRNDKKSLSISSQIHSLQ